MPDQDLNPGVSGSRSATSHGVKVQSSPRIYSVRLDALCLLPTPRIPRPRVCWPKPGFFFHPH